MITFRGGVHGYAGGVPNPAADDASQWPDDSMSPLSSVQQDLRDDGFDVDFIATEEGALQCPTCGATTDAADMDIERRARFEGQSDPGDEQILLAVTCPCGQRGVFASAYGMSASPAATAVLQKVARSARPD